MQNVCICTESAVSGALGSQRLTAHKKITGGRQLQAGWAGLQGAVASSVANQQETKECGAEDARLKGETTGRVLTS